MVALAVNELNHALTRFVEQVPDPALAIEIAVCVEILRRYGNETRRPTSAPLGDGIFELRPKTARHQARLLYCFYGEAAVILVCFIKQGGKDPTNEYKQEALRLRARMKRGEGELHGYDYTGRS